MEASHLSIIKSLWEVASSLVIVLLSLHAYNVRKLNKILTLAIEHETLMQWYCEEHGIHLSDLPTRHKGGPFVAGEREG